MPEPKQKTTDPEGLEAMIAQGGHVGADRAIIEILGQEYGGGDGHRMVVASRLWDALHRCGVLKEANRAR